MSSSSSIRDRRRVCAQCTNLTKGSSRSSARFSSHRCDRPGLAPQRKLLVQQGLCAIGGQRSQRNTLRLLERPAPQVVHIFFFFTERTRQGQRISLRQDSSDARSDPDGCQAGTRRGAPHLAAHSLMARSWVAREAFCEIAVAVMNWSMGSFWKPSSSRHTA